MPARSTVGRERESPWDWLVGRFTYALGGGLFGLLVAAGFARFAFRRDGLEWLAVIPAIFFVTGFIGGESFINWIGRYFRDREERRS